ncbi:hypothetical protein RRG08_010643 [Elysia crispata]|uniref:Uncharacterized protein n=1 Tax=Elysia crispata TaxID=231223 RepID=A0AAE0Z0Y2_9GAST|nr:hypothetical protein RRG08_010643 [Elysia crispata]
MSNKARLEFRDHPNWVQSPQGGVQVAYVSTSITQFKDVTPPRQLTRRSMSMPTQCPCHSASDKPVIYATL